MAPIFGCISESVEARRARGFERSISMSHHYRIRRQSILWAYLRDSISRYRLNVAIRFRPIKHLRKWNAIDTRSLRSLLQVKFAIKNGFRINNGSIERDIFSSWRDNGKSSVSATFSAQPVTQPFSPAPVPSIFQRDIRTTNLPSYISS